MECCLLCSTAFLGPTLGVWTCCPGPQRAELEQKGKTGVEDLSVAVISRRTTLMPRVQLGPSWMWEETDRKELDCGPLCFCKRSICWDCWEISGADCLKLRKAKCSQEAHRIDKMVGPDGDCAKIDVGGVVRVWHHHSEHKTAHGHGEEAWRLFQVRDGASGEEAENRRHQQNTRILKIESQRCLRNWKFEHYNKCVL